MSQNVNLSAAGPPDTVLDAEPREALDRLAGAEELEGEQRRAAVAAVVADHPRCLAAWARLGELARDDVEAYAAFRVGYHRGLDRLRANGWRGTGHVRWEHPENRGFLSSLDGLRRAARAIGETDEEERCAHFLAQLDPAGAHRPRP
jgi:hypothetical protein